MKEAAAPTMKMKINQDAWAMRMKTKARNRKQGWLNAAPRHFRWIAHCSRASSDDQGEHGLAMKEAAGPKKKDEDEPGSKDDEDEDEPALRKEAMAEFDTEALALDCTSLAIFGSRGAKDEDEHEGGGFDDEG